MLESAPNFGNWGLNLAKYKVVVPGSPGQTGNYALEMEALASTGAEIVEVSGASEGEFLEGARDADAVIAKRINITSSMIEQLDRCKIIALPSVGLDSVDVAAATAKGIPVTNCPDTFIQEVAEHTAVLILGAYRRLLLMDRIVREGRWFEGRPVLYRYPRLFGQTFGLISFGNIPRAVVPLMRPFGMQILAHDPFVRETVMIQHGVEPVSLTELLQRSDIISNHLPGTGGTTKLIGEEQFRLMKPRAIFVNTGRGSTVDETAMIRALQEGWIDHAALDVLEHEPPDPDNPLLKMENVTLTAHVASASNRFDVGSRRRVGREISLVFSGRWPLSCVNPSVLEDSDLLKGQSG